LRRSYNFGGGCLQTSLGGAELRSLFATSCGSPVIKFMPSIKIRCVFGVLSKKGFVSVGTVCSTIFCQFKFGLILGKKIFEKGFPKVAHSHLLG
jgi:hypothetical protein